MAFAAVTTVRLEGRDPTDEQKLLSEVLVPRLRELPGFQTARFMRSPDGTSGVGTLIFDTESNARAALDGLTNNRAAELPPVESTAIYEVVLET